MGYLSRKEAIVLSTISLIHERGISNISMKEIANREGVTEASLYKHFKSKDELLGAVMEYYEHYDQFIYNTLQNNKEQAIDNIAKYFTIYAEYYNNYREITALIHVYDVLAYDQNFSKRAGRLIEEKNLFIEALIKKAQEDKELCTEIQPESIACILLGSFDRIIVMWRFMNYSFSLIGKTKEIIGDVIRAYRKKAVNGNLL